MELFLNILIFIGKSIYTTLPAVAANGAPILMKRVNFLNYPMDFNKTIGNDRILGDHKTFRGLFFGVLFSMIVINIQYLIFYFTKVELTIYNFNQLNFQILGFLMGFGVIMGDLVKSFIKRRLRIEPGKRFIPWDQIDCALGGLLFGRIVWDFPIEYGISIIFITFFMHIAIRYIASLFGVCEKW
ncbi:MAG TPA: CDP-archaeol synthase [Spirochaetota bacterium]|nr:CDP-archaeol synthase [Spirochaetota bacterium]